MTINFKAPEIKELQPRLLVMGVGGAGGNAINEMIENNLQGVEFIAVNTDAQDLKLSKCKTRIQIGLNLTKGLGAGAKLDIGQAAADESLNEIVNTLQGANMGASSSFNFSSTTTSNPITHGANALKLDNEIVQEQHQEQFNSEFTNEEVMHTNNLETESVVEDTSVNEMEKSFTQEAIETPQEQTVDENIEEDISNDLKEFGVDSDAPDLFSSESENSSSDDLLSLSDEEDDDLEIPAFLRRQKN